MNFNYGSIFDVEVILHKAVIDDRGFLTELWRADEEDHKLEIDRQQDVKMVYASITLSGVQRGPHQHVDQTDLFVFLGPGKMEVSLWDVREDSKTKGKKMVFIANEGTNEVGYTTVRVPKRIIHAYRNVDKEFSMVLNFPDQLYAGYNKQYQVDEVRWEGIPEEEFTDV